LLALTAPALGGCAVVGSTATFIEQPGESVPCVSTLGSYSLPKTALKFQITKNPNDAYHVLQDVGQERIPDSQHTFCLDYLRSATSSDQVRMFKNKITAEETDENLPGTTIKLRKTRQIKGVSQDNTPFLQLIASRAVDHTAGIIRRIIRTAFTLLSNKGDFTPASRARSAAGTKSGDNVVVADFQVDPFDYQEMARVNEIARTLGFCFVLEDYTFNRSRASGTTADRYCSEPTKTAVKMPPPAAEAIERLHYLVPKPVDGIFYRPRAGYRLSIYIKDNPNGRGTWRLGKSMNLNMENIMPIVSVGVARAVFATRRTGLVFDDGMLTNVCISKGSEAESAIQIPLDVVYGLIALPSEMLSAARDDASRKKQLLDAQARLIKAQNDYIRFLNQDKATTAAELTSADTEKKGNLVLGAPAGSSFPEDLPPDAGEIFKDTNGDALSEICAELAAVRTLDGKNDDGSPKKGTF